MVTYPSPCKLNSKRVILSRKSPPYTLRFLHLNTLFWDPHFMNVTVKVDYIRKVRFMSY